MKWFLALAAAFIVLASSPAAQARNTNDGGVNAAVNETLPAPSAPVVIARRGNDLAEADAVLPLDQVLANLRARYSGNMLEVKGGGRDGDGRPYRIKWLTDEGAVLYITVDARTGDIISVQGDD